MAEILDALFDEYKANRSPISNYGMERAKSSHTTPKICGNCKRTEGKLEIFKICRRCKQVKVPKNHPMYHHYCCKECQTQHWKVHRFEHTEYEQHHGAFLDNEQVHKYEGEIKRFRFAFDEACGYNREKVLEMMIDHLGKPNLLSVFTTERGKYWYVDIKDGPHIDRVRCEGLKHSVEGTHVFRTFPCLLEYGDLYPEEEMALDPFGRLYNDINSDRLINKNTIELSLGKDSDLTRDEVVELFHEKFGKGCLLCLYDTYPGVWLASMRELWHVNELMNTGVEYKLKGVTAISYPKYLGKNGNRAHMEMVTNVPLARKLPQFPQF